MGIILNLADVLPVLVTNEELLELDSALETCRADARLALQLALAWHLRQRDTPRALILVSQIRASLLDLIASLPERTYLVIQARLQLIEGEVKWLFDEFKQSEDLARQALATFNAVSDSIGSADAHWLLAFLMIDLGKPDHSSAELALSMADARRAGDFSRISLAEAVTARSALLHDVSNARGRWGVHFDTDISKYHPGVVAWIYEFLGVLAFLSADVAGSISYLLRIYDLAINTGQIRRAVLCTSSIGRAFGNLSDYESGLEWIELGVTTARRTGWPLCIGTNLMHAGELLRSMGRLDAAHEMLEEALNQLRHRASSRAYALTTESLGSLQIDRCNFDAALSAFTDCENLADALKQAELHIGAQRGKTIALAHLGRRDDALAMAESALALVRKVGDVANEVEILQVMGQIYVLNPDETDGTETALTFFEQALAIAATIEDFIVPAALLDAVAREYAKIGNTGKAYSVSLQSAIAKEKANSTEAVNRAIAMQVRHETERARADSIYHRELAASESRRAQAMQKINETLEGLSLIGQEITAQLDAEAIFETLDRHVHGLLDATYFSIYVVSEDGSALECEFGNQDNLPLPALRILLTDPTSNVAECARGRREILLGQNAPILGDLNHIAGTAPSLSALFAPLAIGTRLLGVMSIQSPHAAAYAERELLIFRTLCAYASIGLDNAVAYRRVESALASLREAQSALMNKNAQLEIAHREQQIASLTDPLTGMHNRRYLNEQMDALVASERQKGFSERRTANQPSDSNGKEQIHSLHLFFMIDLDHFKLVNDIHGHQAGDLVLIQLRERLEQVAREGDYLVRWGGEEFLLVAKVASRSVATVIAERLRLAVASVPFDLGDGVTLIKTCSIGFSSFPFSDANPAELSWSQALDVADRALYLSKHNGRDCWSGLCAPSDKVVDHLLHKITHDLDASIAGGDIDLLRSWTSGKRANL